MQALLQSLGSKRKLRYFQALGVFLYTLFVLLGVHGSSMGIIGGQGSEVLIGKDQAIRSDEYLRLTPIAFGIKSNLALNGQTVLSESFSIEPTSVFLLANLDKIFLSYLPQSNYFAALWWTPFLLVWIFLSQLLSYFKVPDSMNMAATVLMISSPGVAWWSFIMLDIIGRYSLVLCLIFTTTFLRRNSLLDWIRSVLAALILASLIFIYQPWVICVGLIMYAPVLLFKANEKLHKAIAIKTTLLFTFFFFWNLFQNFDFYLKQSATIYPGMRTASGGVPNLIEWFSTGTLGTSLWHPQILNGSNQSELSIGFGILLIPFLYYFVQNNWKHRSYATISSIGLLVLVFWSAVPFPPLEFNPLRLVPASRAAAAWTILLPFCLVLIWSETRSEKFEKKPINPKKTRTFLTQRLDQKSLIASLITLVLLSQGVLYLKSIMGSISVPAMFFFGSVTVLGIYKMFGDRQSQKMHSLVVFSLMSIMISAPVNPLVIGAKAYFDIDISNDGTIDRGSIWVSDDIRMDARLIAQGYASITGQQMYAPNREKWKLLDPEGKYENAWNRGASYVTVNWGPPGSQISISNTANDSILIIADPCSPEFSLLEVSNIATTRSLEDYSCITEIRLRGENTGDEGKFWLYEISP